MSPTKSSSAIPAWIAAALAITAAATLLLAQWQVNTQANARVNNRVGGEMYGNMGSVKYASYQTQTNLLPSEARYATWRSGALPSEIAMNAAAVGPLAPNGVINYLPPPNAVQQAGRAPTPQLYNPAYRIDDRVDQGPAPMTGYGTIRYAPQAAAAPRPGQVPSPLISGAAPSAQLPSGQVTGEVKPIAPPPINMQVNGYARSPVTGMNVQTSPALQMGSIRYATPDTPTVPPATRPTLQ